MIGDEARLGQKIVAVTVFIKIMSFVPVIIKQKLYSWIPSLLFMMVEIFAFYKADWIFDPTTPHYLTYTIFISKIAFYLSMLPNLIRYNIYIVTSYYFTIAGIHIAMLYTLIRYINHEADIHDILYVNNFAGFVNKFDMVFPILEMIY